MNDACFIWCNYGCQIYESEMLEMFRPPVHLKQDLPYVSIMFDGSLYTVMWVGLKGYCYYGYRPIDYRDRSSV